MSAQGTVVITCGPAYEPIDEVRRITNHSTGELGTMLANRLAEGGWKVICLIGAGATADAELAEGVQRISFTTNDDLLRRLSALPERGEVSAVLHVAALGDFRVKEVRDSGGAALAEPKIPSRNGEVTLVLEPAAKVIAKLRLLFPMSRLVGWKYELSGTVEEAIEKAHRQIFENATDACVVNGAAYGSGFGMLMRDGSRAHAESRAALCEWMAGWLEENA